MILCDLYKKHKYLWIGKIKLNGEHTTITKASFLDLIIILFGQEMETCITDLLELIWHDLIAIKK